MRLHIARRGNGGRKYVLPGLSTLLRVGLGVFTWAALCVILLGYDLFPGRISLKVGERSPELIRAPRLAQYTDLDETERLRREAERRVTPQYAASPYAAADAESRVKRAFQALEMARAREESPEAVQRSFPEVPSAAVAWALEAPQEELDALRVAAPEIVRKVMSREIRPTAADINEAQEEAEALAREREDRPEARALLAELVKREMAPTHQLDTEATVAERAAARQRVQEVVRTIEADHPVLFPGERVTPQHLAMLQALGLASPRLDYRRTLSIGIIVGLIVVVLGVQTRHWARPAYEELKLLLLLSLLAVVPLFVINLLTLALPNVWMLIVPAAALMAAVLVADAVGLALAVALSLLVGLMANAGLPATLVSLGSAAAGLSLVSYIWPVSRLRWIVGAMSGANLLLVAAIGLLQAQPLVGVAREAGLAALLYSPGAAVMSLGGIFLLQRPFRITTDLWLLELSNPQHPLLRRLQSEAPGTYFGCLMVADLADAAAEAVGANALLARVAALYHDIGKLSRPAFFVENQALLGVENVHDKLSSSLSALIIISHVKDGVEMAREHRLPRELVDTIGQHHGTTLVSYFYQRALSGERPESVSENQFRYPGPLPRTKEAALVMLADSVQAAVKSIAEPTPPRVQQMVREIIRDRVVDGQLKECDLTFRDVAAVEATMARMLTASLFHTRIEYPEPLPVRRGA